MFADFILLQPSFPPFVVYYNWALLLYIFELSLLVYLLVAEIQVRLPVYLGVLCGPSLYGLISYIQVNETLAPTESCSTNEIRIFSGMGVRALLSATEWQERKNEYFDMQEVSI